MGGSRLHHCSSSGWLTTLDQVAGQRVVVECSPPFLPSLVVSASTITRRGDEASVSWLYGTPHSTVFGKK